MIRMICFALVLALSISQVVGPAAAGGDALQIALGPAQSAPQTLFAGRPRLVTQAQTRKLMCSSTVACPAGYFCCPGFSSVSLCCPTGRTCNYGKFRCD